MTKPRPAPAKAQTPPSTPTPGERSPAAERQNQGENAAGESISEEGSRRPPASAAEPMDTHNTKTSPSE